MRRSGASPDQHARGNLWQVLADCVCQAGQDRGDAWLRVDDSKKVYDRKHIASLERTVLAFAQVLGLRNATVAELLAALGADVRAGATTQCPWYADLSQRLPLDPARSACAGAAERLAATFQRCGVRCCGLRIELLPEDTFNQQVALTHNKAAVELTPVLRLMQWGAQQCGGGTASASNGRKEARPVSDARAAEDLLILVDRLGGRTDYRELLMEAFPDRHLHVVEVAEECSRYRLAAPRSDWHVEFRINGDSLHLPIALASMLAKYVRELIMDRFNAYWNRLAPQLKATAGYYADARRFIRSIGPLAEQAGLPLDRFVRAR